MARVYDFWLGGKDNYAADRVVAEQVAAAYPDVRAAVRAQRAFLARPLLTSSPQGTTAYIDADLRATGAILERAADIIARLMEAVPPGSYLAISQIASDVAADEVAEGVQRYNQQAAAPVAARTHAEVSQFFASVDLVEPGVVQVHRWRPGAGDQDSARNLAIYAGVGRKP